MPVASGAPDLETWFRRRAITSAGLLLLVMGVGLLVVRQDATRLYDGLTSGWGLAFAVLAVVATLVTALLLSRMVLRGPGWPPSPRSPRWYSPGGSRNALMRCPRRSRSTRREATPTPCAG